MDTEPLRAAIRKAVNHLRPAGRLVVLESYTGLDPETAAALEAEVEAARDELLSEGHDDQALAAWLDIARHARSLFQTLAAALPLVDHDPDVPSSALVHVFMAAQPRDAFPTHLHRQIILRMHHPDTLAALDAARAARWNRSGRPEGRPRDEDDQGPNPMSRP